MTRFNIGSRYTRADLYASLNVPGDRQHGAWNTGYRDWEGEMYVFATVGSASVSGFDYPNKLHPDGSMTWTGVDASHDEQNQIRAIRDGVTHVFVRDKPRKRFTYLGAPREVETVQRGLPARFLFRFGEIRTDPEPRLDSFREDGSRDVRETAHERDSETRIACHEVWGSVCSVCGIDAPWNHVHHLYPHTGHDDGRVLQPVADVRPVCPLCHALIHWHEPLLTVEEAILLWRAELS